MSRSGSQVDSGTRAEVGIAACSPRSRKARSRTSPAFAMHHSAIATARRCRAGVLFRQMTRLERPEVAGDVHLSRVRLSHPTHCTGVLPESDLVGHWLELQIDCERPQQLYGPPLPLGGVFSSGVSTRPRLAAA
jgi:hypothetical protein